MAAVYMSETPLLKTFVFGWSSNFLGSESGHLQSYRVSVHVKVLQC